MTKTAHNPLREGLSPWDLPWRNTYPTVIYDAAESLFKLFYHGDASCAPHNPECPSFYYAGGNGPHSGPRADFIALATAPSHELVGLRSVGQNASLLSPPFLVANASHLTVTAHVAEGGFVEVQVLGATDGSVLAADVFANARNSPMGKRVELLAADPWLLARPSLRGSHVRLKITATLATMFAAEWQGLETSTKPASPSKEWQQQRISKE